jgi:hypothetical protein
VSSAWLQHQNTEIFRRRCTSDHPLTFTVQLKLVHQAAHDMEQYMNSRPVDIVCFRFNRDASNDLGRRTTANQDFQTAIGVDLPNRSTQRLRLKRSVSRKVGGEKDFQETPFGSGKRPKRLLPRLHPCR